jgi:hypothetical protein
MKGLFVELPAFARHRSAYLDDESYMALQNLLMTHPDAGTLIPETGGLRKLRFGDGRRGKGKRGGLRVIYYWWVEGFQFWLFTVYDKGEMADLTSYERRSMKAMLKAELESRRNT